jgi:hypothetical protein
LRKVSGKPQRKQEKKAEILQKITKATKDFALESDDDRQVKHRRERGFFTEGNEGVADRY